MNIGTLLKSKTVWGAAAATAAYLLKQPHLDPWTILQAVGGFLTVVGARDAIANVERK